MCGSVLILSRPAGYFENTDFRLKFACMTLAGANMLVFQFITVSRRLGRSAPPVAAGAGICSKAGSCRQGRQ
jgi:hypothetical protein